MNEAYVALGTNIEPRENYINKGLQLLDDHPNITIQKKSSIYETAPVGYAAQSDFLNMVVQVTTSLSANELLDACQRIEEELGRERTIRFGPRTIDLDILTYNQENSTVERLMLPHPRMHERAFVLIPLQEIAPGYTIPVKNKTVDSYINELPETDKKDVKKWIKSESEEE
ncbi:2-amino-4-hydroxy-6-hydroxymethyldihydropteridine diphosphokinase [Oceanobacillus sp. 1P07AA]|uniref:2-amino-4-hydroxy-6- hydroxymethyldihydropteridine diphosphokinase n=1 Tax=Oceanobacillus sp. 1P07AA TaxID=3132293 RepID=UPI0039A775E2